MTALEDHGPTPTFADPRVGALDVSRETGDPDLFPRDHDHLDPLAALAEIAEPVDMPDAIVPHRFRPGWAVRYSTVVDSDDVKRWRKASTLRKGSPKEELDEARFACIGLGNLCLAIIRNGEELIDPATGEPLKFGSRPIRELYGAETVAECVRKFYSNDPYLGATFEAVLREAGVGEEVEALDPTQPSSD